MKCHHDRREELSPFPISLHPRSAILRSRSRPHLPNLRWSCVRFFFPSFFANFFRCVFARPCPYLCLLILYLLVLVVNTWLSNEVSAIIFVFIFVDDFMDMFFNLANRYRIGRSAVFMYTCIFWNLPLWMFKSVYGNINCGYNAVSHKISISSTTFWLFFSSLKNVLDFPSIYFYV